MPLQLKRVGAGDVGLFCDIAPEVFDEPIVAERLAVYLAAPSHLMVVAIDGGMIVGQTAAVLHLHPDKPTELYIDEVGVTPGLQRRGIARAMMDEMAAWGAELGCEDAWLGTEHDNEPAKALYAKYTEPEPILMYYWEL
ncbi:MAG: hypothetical protein RLZ98_1952 [Pseudomonadota bacterium]|jgi:aminoglycoside 6'-N-acetyltransferase I